MERVAIATDGAQATGHFGHCEGFTIIDVEDGRIVDRRFIPNPGHKPGFLPMFLGDQGINTVVSGGMGAMAVNLFNERGIDVIIGAVGSVDDVMDQYLAKTLVSTGSVCERHEHEHECGEHN